MTNRVKLKGYLKNIQYSHTINDTEYQKADLIVKKHNGEEDIINLIFKKYCNIYKDGDFIDVVGNVRSFSQKVDDNKSTVMIYVFTYFDDCDESEEDVVNDVVLQGRVCKLDQLRTTSTGKQNFHFILANNIISPDGASKLNNYIPVVLWGKQAIKNKDLKINDEITIKGQLHSRYYRKKTAEDDYEIQMAHELVGLEVTNEAQV